ncbi:1-acyl-sn-glycerol-3-phosphate acyltransferase [Simkania sp.]|uniref:1-acyl-sn-glycerol-3-phosphate acyltransferase n=1 Tax=Simkania sp. TaxID=34094 RepID=UPI003B52F7F6
MEQNSNSNLTLQSLREKIRTLISSGHVPEKYEKILEGFLESYQSVIASHKKNLSDCLPSFELFLSLIEQQFQKPYLFEPYHKCIRAPIDYYKFGLDFLRPLVDLPHSTVNGLGNLKQIATQLEKKENVILFANHQIEADPQAISVLLENHEPKFAENLIFVAGTRVTTDPLAIPFSMGRNLLCIHSKKYIDDPPEQKHEKQLHNKRTMELMSELLSEGGHAIYVAPSGGRDRTNAEGEIEIAPFDPQSIEMFYLMTQRAKQKTHFYTLALSTYHLLPPPETTDTEIGETRITHGGAIHLAFGPEVDMENIPNFTEETDKHEKRKIRAEFLWRQVKEEYDKFP